MDVQPLLLSRRSGIISYVKEKSHNGYCGFSRCALGVHTLLWSACLHVCLVPWRTGPGMQWADCGEMFLRCNRGSLRISGDVTSLCTVPSPLDTSKCEQPVGRETELRPTGSFLIHKNDNNKKPYLKTHTRSFCKTGNRRKVLVCSVILKSDVNSLWRPTFGLPREANQGKKQ